MMTVLPAAMWASGAVSSMVMVESIPVNMYLLYLANRFKSEGGQTNANAKKIFMCSLWYLPLLMASIVFHSKNWSKNAATDDNENKDLDYGTYLQNNILAMKEKFKELCVHEIAIEKVQEKNLVLNKDVSCPKISIDSTKLKIEKLKDNNNKTIIVKDN